LPLSDGTFWIFLCKKHGATSKLFPDSHDSRYIVIHTDLHSDHRTNIYVGHVQIRRVDHHRVIGLVRSKTTMPRRWLFDVDCDLKRGPQRYGVGGATDTSRGHCVLVGRVWLLYLRVWRD